MKIECNQCKSKFSMPKGKVPGKIVSVICPKCKNKIRIEIDGKVNDNFYYGTKQEIPEIPDDYEGIGGKFRGLSIIDTLQILGAQGGYYTLTIQSETGVGYIYIKKGNPIDAIIDDYSGRDAFYEMCQWNDPLIEISALEPGRKRTLNAGRMELILAVLKFMEDGLDPHFKASDALFGGVGSWNTYRSTKEASLVLAGIDLREKDLSGIDFSNVNLRAADLRSANLDSANLSYAKLHYAKLEGTSLVNANLYGLTIDKVAVSHIDKLIRDEYEHSFNYIVIKNEENIIKNSIHIPPEYKQAGLSILNYFSNVVTQKYKDINVGITIEQKEDEIRMIIETPEGKRDIVEEFLYDYGLVVRGEMQAEELLDNPMDILAFQHKLDMVQLELKNSYRLLEAERNIYGQRIDALEGIIGKAFDAQGKINLQLPQITFSPNIRNVTNIQRAPTLRIKNKDVPRLVSLIENAIISADSVSQDQKKEITEIIRKIKRKRFIGVKSNLESILRIIYNVSSNLLSEIIVRNF